MITQEYLKECLSYDPETGVFTWLSDRPVSHFKSVKGYKSWKTQCAGKQTGYKDKHGYTKITISSKTYNAHALAWVYFHGCYPKEQIDHINGLRTDNRMCNLREVTHMENCKNQRIPINSTTGVIGVCRRSDSGKYQASIKHEGKQIFLGYYDNIFDAACARRSAEIKYGYHINHGKTRNDVM